MKRNWQPEERIEHWTIIPTELELLTKKTARNRLGIALLLKYFQYEGRFPTAKAEVPREVVRYVAQLLKLSPGRFDRYDWQGQTIKAHRAIVRDFLGITEATVKDTESSLFDSHFSHRSKLFRPTPSIVDTSFLIEFSSLKHNNKLNIFSINLFIFFLF